MRIYVGNLVKEITEAELKQEFQAFGAVDSVALIKDKFSGLPKGFAFIEMPVRSEAEAAVKGLHRKEFKGQSMDVNEARPQPERRRGGNRGNWGGGKKGNNYRGDKKRW
jgi:RNA recognition motif-containing protein